MKLLIEIPDAMYHKIVQSDKYYLLNYADSLNMRTIEVAILNGIIIPEHHGRLIDVDELYENSTLCHTEEDGTACIEWREINDAPTIIEGSEENADSN